MLNSLFDAVDSNVEEDPDKVPEDVYERVSSSSSSEEEPEEVFTAHEYKRLSSGITNFAA